MAKLNPAQLKAFQQASDPTVNEDLSNGYQVSNIIVNTTTNKSFICLDATNGAAVWELITHGSSPLIAMFNAYRNTPDPDVTGSGGTAYIIPYDAERFDTGGNFVSTTFTAPVNGYYMFVFNMNLGQVSTVNHTAIDGGFVLGGIVEPVVGLPVLHSGNYIQSYIKIWHLTATQTAYTEIRVGGSATTVDIAIGCSFQGFLIAAG